MKQLKYILITLITSTISCYGIMTCGFLTRSIITSNSIQRSPLGYANDEQNYTTGGTIFTYPNNFFTLPPVIQVSIKQNISHPVTETYVAEISANSINATTVIVYQINAGVVSEAANNSVTVCLFAIDDSI